MIRLFILDYDSFFYIEYDFPFHYFILWLCFVSISSHGICIGHSLAEGSREKQTGFYKALKSLSKQFHIRSRQHILLQNLRNQFPRQCAFWTPLGLMEEEWFFWNRDSACFIGLKKSSGSLMELQRDACADFFIIF